MALIDCPECGKRVSNRAAACPECGNPIRPVKAITDFRDPPNTQIETKSPGEATAMKAVTGMMMVVGTVLLFVPGWNVIGVFVFLGGFFGFVMGRFME